MWLPAYRFPDLDPNEYLRFKIYKKRVKWMVRFTVHEKNTGSLLRTLTYSGFCTFEAAMRLVVALTARERSFASVDNSPVGIDFETFRRDRNEQELLQFRIGESLQQWLAR